MDEPVSLTPITVTVIIDMPHGAFSVSKTQQFVRRRNDRPGRGPVPLQSLSGLWKEALADINPYIRRHTAAHE